MDEGIQQLYVYRTCSEQATNYRANYRELNLHKNAREFSNVQKSEETSGANSVFGPSHFLGDLHSQI